MMPAFAASPPAAGTCGDSGAMSSARPNPSARLWRAAPFAKIAGVPVTDVERREPRTGRRGASLSASSSSSSSSSSDAANSCSRSPAPERRASVSRIELVSSASGTEDRIASLICIVMRRCSLLAGDDGLLGTSAPRA
jgi:hypothetical protein